MVVSQQQGVDNKKVSPSITSPLSSSTIQTSSSLYGLDSTMSIPAVGAPTNDPNTATIGGVENGSFSNHENPYFADHCTCGSGIAPPPLPAAAIRDGRNPAQTASLRQRQRLMGLTIQAGLLIGMIGVLILQQFYFKDTWGRDCDYYLKVWCTVWVARYIIYYALLLVLTKLAVRGRTQTKLYKRLIYVKYTLHLFNLGWFFYGIKPILVDERCDHTTGTWGLVLWWLEFVVTVGPIICFCLLLPFIFCYVMCFVTDEDAPSPTPPDVRKELKTVKYKEVQDYLESQQALSLGTAPSQSSDQATSHGISSETATEEPLNPISNISVTLTGVPLPDVSQFKRLQSGLLGVGGRSQQLDRLTSSASQLHTLNPSASVLGRAKNAVSCPICFCDFEEEDCIVQLPCDNRHAFHKDCLFAWLDKSQQCPVCRSNIVSSLKKSKEGNDTTTDHKDATEDHVV